jgi:hypothetical protein
MICMYFSPDIRVYVENEVKEYEVGRTYGTHGRDEKCTQRSSRLF